MFTVKGGNKLTLQQEIIKQLKVKPVINAKEEIKVRISFLKQYLLKTKANGYVLGISGGQDSTLAGKLVQMAISELNQEVGAKKYTFYAIRLPYGAQIDEQDAEDAIKFIQPEQAITINIKDAVDASCATFAKTFGTELSDFNKGNTKARERMKVQYDVGAHFRCLVVGTDHAAESITGFYTKHGDGACDIAPLYGLNKRQGRQLLEELKCPPHLYTKIPTADLEEDRPGLPDEFALGVTYDHIDDYLEGKDVPQEAREKIEHLFTISKHKRHLPPTIYDDWWKG